MLASNMCKIIAQSSGGDGRKCQRQNGALKACSCILVLSYLYDMKPKRVNMLPIQMQHGKFCMIPILAIDLSILILLVLVMSSSLVIIPHSLPLI